MKCESLAQNLGDCLPGFQAKMIWLKNRVSGKLVLLEGEKIEKVGYVQHSSNNLLHFLPLNLLKLTVA
jgi:hypothetical protein